MSNTNTTQKILEVSTQANQTVRNIWGQTILVYGLSNYIEYAHNLNQGQQLIARRSSKDKLENLQTSNRLYTERFPKIRSHLSLKFQFNLTIFLTV